MSRLTGFDDKELYTVSEIARLLSCGNRLVENLIAKRELESSLMPGTRRARRVSREQLDRYLSKFHGKSE